MTNLEPSEPTEPTVSSEPTGPIKITDSRCKVGMLIGEGLELVIDKYGHLYVSNGYSTSLKLATSGYGVNSLIDHLKRIQEHMEDLPF